jgi:hypothetical protein
MKRPTGVTILAVLAIIYGIFNLLLVLLALLGAALAVSGLSPRAIPYSIGTLGYAAISDAILGILFLAFGIGALQLKRWAWITGVVALVLDVVRQIVGVVMHGFTTGNIVSFSITIVVALVVLWYLFRPNVRAAFGFRKTA